MSAAVHDVGGSTKNLIYFYASGCVTGFLLQEGPAQMAERSNALQFDCSAVLLVPDG